MPSSSGNKKHALLSASSAARWLSCPPSAKLEKEFREALGEEVSSVYADEGTLAHEFAEAIIRSKLGKISKSQLEKRLKELRSHELYREEMETEVDKYVEFVRECYSDAKHITPDPSIFVEEKVDFSAFVKDGFGTTDAVIIADETMEIVDLKYGKGVKVEAEENPQLKLYAIGALEKYAILYQISQVRLTIFQPRLNHVSSWVISVPNLYRWVNEVVKPIAAKAYKGEGSQKPGDHCKFCLVKASCSALAKQNMALAKHDFAEPSLLTQEQLIEAYQQLPLLIDWANSVGEYLLKKAISGEKIDGYKLVEGVSRRKWSDESKVKEKLKAEGYPEDSYIKTQLRGISEIEKLVGKKAFFEAYEEFTIKPQGSPILVKETDKRPEYRSLEQAKSDFGE